MMAVFTSQKSANTGNQGFSPQETVYTFTIVKILVRIYNKCLELFSLGKLKAF